MFANQRETEVAKADASLAIMKAELQQKSKIAELQSAETTAIRDAEMERVLESKKAEVMLEKLRTENLTKAKVQYEVSVETANADLYQSQEQAEAGLYKQRTSVQAENKCTSGTERSRCRVLQETEVSSCTSVLEAEGSRRNFCSS